MLRASLSAFLLAACVATPIEVRDGGVAQLDGRMLYRLRPADESGAWTGIELDLLRLDGDSTQELGAGQTLLVDGTSIFGPAQVDIDYELRHGALAWVAGRDTEDADLRALFGLGWQALELELASGVERASLNEDWAGVLVGLAFQWRPAAWLGLGARADWTSDLTSELRELELGAEIPARAPLALFLGWRWLDAYRVVESGSDIDLRVDGPAIGVRGSL